MKEVFTQMKKNLLIVDDQPGIRLLLMDIFKNEGYHVETAKTGKEAFEKISTNTFDLMMLDYRLPIMDAQQVIEKMKQEQIVVPVIIMTGLIEEMDEQFKKETDMLKVVAKPFDVGDICTLAEQLTAT